MWIVIPPPSTAPDMLQREEGKLKCVPLEQVDVDQAVPQSSSTALFSATGGSIRHGDAGLRAIRRAAAPGTDPVLDWFHIAIRWQHVHQLASGAIHYGQAAETRAWLLDRIDRAKWALWERSAVESAVAVGGKRPGDTVHHGAARVS